MYKNILTISPNTVLVIFVSFFLSFGQSVSQTNKLVNVTTSNTASDTTLQKYTDEELLEFQKQYNVETDKLLQQKEIFRQKGIQNFEAFIRMHSDSPELDKVIITLAHLQYEQAVQNFGDVNEDYNNLITLYDQGKIKEEPAEPKQDYSLALTLYQQIIDDFPNSTLADDAIYYKGFLLKDLGRNEDSFVVFNELMEDFPESPYIPDALMLMAEYYFNPPVNDIEKAIETYNQVLEFKESSKYDAALYRLGWAYYRMSDYPTAISYFTILTDDIDRVHQIDPQYKYHFPEVREEAIEYIGISFLDFGGPSRAADFFNAIGGRNYGIDVLQKIGDSYLEVKEEYDKAIVAYQLLVKLYPDSPRAPAIQARIADAYSNINNEQLVYERRAELFEKYKSDSEWWQNIEDPDAKNSAIALTEKAVRDNINYLLKRAEEAGDQKLFLQAVSDSRDYLTSFPLDSHAVKIHWNMAITLDSKLTNYDAAYDEYLNVSNLYWNSEFQKQAAKNAIAIWDEAVKQENSVNDGQNNNLSSDNTINQTTSSSGSLQSGLKIQRKELSDNEKKLAFACDNYIKLFPHEPETAKIVAKTGALYYEHYQFSEALKYNNTLVKHFPESDEANNARYIVMESYFGKSDYSSAEVIAKKLRNTNTEFSVKANTRLAESIFLTAKEYSDSGNHLNAAEEYSRVVAETPTAAFADLALFNAAHEYKKAKEYNKAIDSYSQLVTNYPQSKHYLSSLNNLAFDYREMNDFHNAGLTYEKLANLQPDEKEAEVALYNASVTYSEAEEWLSAIKVNSAFVKRFPNAEDADKLLFNNANYYLKLNDINSANNIYAEFTRKYPNSPGVVEAFYHRGMYSKTNSRLGAAKSEFSNAITKNTELIMNKKITNDFFAAEALYELTNIKFSEFKNIEFTLPPQNLTNNKNRKKTLLVDLVDSYTKIAGYGTLRLPEATYRRGEVYEEFAETWAHQEIPVTDENKKILAQKEINKNAGELYEQAVNAYKDGLNGLVKFSNSYKKATDTTADEYQTYKITSKDSTLLVTEAWIAKCQDKISANLYNVAEINHELVNQFLNAPTPPGMQKIEVTVYRAQLLDQAVSPILNDIINAHIRNIDEGQALNLDNKWIEMSRNKVIKSRNLTPYELQKLGYEALTGYSALINQFNLLVEKGDEKAFDIADQMSSNIELSRNLTKSSTSYFIENIKEFRKLNLQTPEVVSTEENILESIYDYGVLADSLSAMANAQRLHFEKLNTDKKNLDYEDASLNYDEHHFALKDGAKELLNLGHEVSKELDLKNKISKKITLALVRINPEEFVGDLGLEIKTQLITSSSDWLVTSDFFPNWTEVNFDDSLWSHAYDEGSSSYFAGSGANSIWLINIDPSQLSETNSLNKVKQASTGESVPATQLTRALKRPNKVYFRKSFNIDGLPVDGIMQLYLDDTYTLFINGKKVVQYDFDTANRELKSHTHNISDYLETGQNVIAIEVSDSDDSNGSLEAALEIKNIPGWNQAQGNFKNHNPSGSENVKNDGNEF